MHPFPSYSLLVLLSLFEIGLAFVLTSYLFFKSLIYSCNELLKRLKSFATYFIGDRAFQLLLLLLANIVSNQFPFNLICSLF